MAFIRFEEFDQLCLDYVTPKLGSLGFYPSGVVHSRAGYCVASYQSEAHYFLDFVIEVADYSGCGLMVREGARPGLGVPVYRYDKSVKAAVPQVHLGDVTAAMAKEIFDHQLEIFCRVRTML